MATRSRRSSATAASTRHRSFPRRGRCGSHPLPHSILHAVRFTSNNNQIWCLVFHVQVRTIFITGLPEDVKERELQNLLRWLPGFEASQLNFKAEKPMGFALFSTPHQAITAKDILQDMLFDPETKSVLHTEMAKKNLFVKRGHTFCFFSFILSQTSL